MDFTRFDSRAGAETAGRLHLLHPATGAKLYADEDQKLACIVLVKGTESRSAQAAMRKARKARMSEDDERDDTLEGLHDNLVAGAIPLIAGFENIARGESAATVADAEWFLNLNMLNGRKGEQSFVEQVMEFASSRANYLGNGSKR